VENSGQQFGSIDGEDPMSEDLATTAAALPRRVRFAMDSDELDALWPTDFVRTYADLIHDEAALTALRARFPDSIVELIDRGLGDPTGQANLFDVESGALTPQQAAERVRADQKAGKHWQTVYCSESNLPEVIDALHGTHYYNWIASWGRMVVASHPTAQVQFADSGMLGVHADLTVIWDPSYRPTRAVAAAAAVARKPAAEAALASATPEVATTAAVAAPAGDEVMAKLRDIFAEAKAHHGALSLLEHDLALVPEMMVNHANLLSELARLIP
jgi:hypothetical protein